MKGWGPKSSVMSFETQGKNFLAGYPGIFAGISRGHPKSLRENSLCSILVPYTAHRNTLQPDKITCV